MNEIEVIAFFHQLPNRIPLKCLTDEYVEKYDNANEIMRRALEKQIAKKPHIVNSQNACPDADCLEPVLRYHNHCPECGQKIDWD